MYRIEIENWYERAETLKRSSDINYKEQAIQQADKLVAGIAAKTGVVFEIPGPAAAAVATVPEVIARIDAAIEALSDPKYSFETLVTELRDWTTSIHLTPWEADFS